MCVRAKPEKIYVRQLLEEVIRLKIPNEKSSLPITTVPPNIARVEKPKSKIPLRT